MGLRLVLVTAVTLVMAAPATTATKPARLKISVSASRVVEWQATQHDTPMTGITSLLCTAAATVSGSGREETRFFTSRPFVLTEAQLASWEGPRPKLEVAVTRTASLAQTFTSAGDCPADRCPVRGYEWFTGGFADGQFVACDAHLAADTSRCGVTRAEIPHVVTFPQIPGHGGYSLVLDGDLLLSAQFFPSYPSGCPLAFGRAVPLQAAVQDEWRLPARELRRRLARGPLVLRGTSAGAWPIDAAGVYGAERHEVGRFTARSSWTIRIERG